MGWFCDAGGDAEEWGGEVEDHTEGADVPALVRGDVVLHIDDEEDQVKPRALHPTPTPCTLHPTSYTLHPSPYILRRRSVIKRVLFKKSREIFFVFRVEVLGVGTTRRGRMCRRWSAR